MVAGEQETPWEEMATADSDLILGGLALDIHDTLYVAAYTGEMESARRGCLLKYEPPNSKTNMPAKLIDQMLPIDESKPVSIVFDEENAIFIADQKRKCVLSRPPSQQGAMDSGLLIHTLISEYESRPLLGPNSLCFDKNGTLFFTDSGPLASFSAPKGSVFSVSSEDQMLKPLAKSCLAHPTGIAVNEAGSIVYVSETLANRVVRFAKRQNGIFYCSVFKTFKGGFGPTSIACDSMGRILVLRTDLASAMPSSLGGRVCMLDMDGTVLKELPTPGPEVWGMLISPSYVNNQPDRLIISERTKCKIWTLPLSEFATEVEEGE